jgi:1,4-alpha-glucan branching enzyme
LQIEPIKEKGTIMARKNNRQEQTFCITAPTARSVLLAGDFTHWQEKAIPMRKQAGGVWKTSVALPPGTHRYRFIVDGQWRDDPDCTLRVSNPYGGEDAVRQITSSHGARLITKVGPGDIRSESHRFGATLTNSSPLAGLS